MNAGHSIQIKKFVAESPGVTLRIPELTIERGAFCALVAKSGAGKSVLLSVLTGHLLIPWMRKGSTVRFSRFLVGNRSLPTAAFSSPEKLRESLKSENLVYLPQKLPDDRSLKRSTLAEMADVVGAVAPDCPRRVAKERLEARCGDLGLQNVLDQRLKDLSGGERRRVEIVARLVGVESQCDLDGKEHVILYLDEPTTGLDPSARLRYFAFLEEARKLFSEVSLTIVCATHDLEILDLGEDSGEERVFDTVAYVRKEEDSRGGKHCSVAWHGDADEFLQSACFQELKGDSDTESGTALEFNDSPPGTGADEEEASPGNDVATSPAPAPPARRNLWAEYLATFDEEMVRAFGKQFLGRGKRLAIAIPMLVGIIVFAAFLARTVTSGERFLFFATIYAFWIGLFNSCQTVNGAVASGEWTYWVLGLRRSFVRYIQANSLVSLVVSLVQVALFAGTIVGFSALWNQNSLLNVFVNPSQLVNFILNVHVISPEILIAVLFFGSLICAATAGVGMGTLVSCLAKDTQGSLKTAVGIVVISMIASTTVLKMEGDSKPASPPLWLKFHLKHYAGTPLLATPAAPSPERSPHLLEDVSLLLPQRYFFNVGRALDDDVLHHKERSDSNPERGPFDYELPDGSPVTENWKIWKKIRNPEILEQERKKLASDGKSPNLWKFPLLIATVAGIEAAACLGLALLYFSVGIVIARNKKSLYELH